MKTAEEVLNSHLPKRTLSRTEIENRSIKAMIEFAKLHTQAALEAVYDKGLDSLTKWDGNPYTGEGSDYLDKDSILNTYPLHNIK